MSPACLPPENLPTPDEDEGKLYKVVIIGAGAAGLQCAQALIQKGYERSDLLILEARTRVGGRVSTAYEKLMTTKGSEVEFALDHGAAWVHGTSVPWGSRVLNENSAVPSLNPMMTLLKRRHDNPFLELDPVFEGNPWTRPRAVLEHKLVLFLNGSQVEHSMMRKAVKYHFECLQSVSDYGNQLFDQGDGMDTIRLSLEDALQRCSLDGHEAFVSRFYRHLIECWNGAQARELPMADFIMKEPVDDAIYEPVGDFEGPHCTVKSGLRTLLEPLLEGDVEDRILLNQPVCGIQDSGGHVLIRTSQGLSVKSQVCVNTMPVGVLAHAVETNVFQVSPEKREAIASMQMGSYKKVFLTFKDIWWAREPPFLGLIQHSASSPLGQYLLIYNLWASKDLPCMEVVLFGGAGRWAVGRSDGEIQAAVMDFIQEAMGVTDVAPVDVHVTRWEEDPYSRGAYSSVAVGASIRRVEELTRPELRGKLIFAGEACVEQFEGSVHAALLSGQETAEAVHLFLSGQGKVDVVETTEDDRTRVIEAG